MLDDKGNPSQGGWRFVTTADGGTVTYGFSQDTCDPNGVIDYYGPFYWTEPTGAVHTFNINTVSATPGCGTSVIGGDAFATDSSGYHMHIPLYHNATVYAKDGTIVHNPSTLFERKDTNGNYFTRDANGNIVDTLNRTPVTVAVNGNQTTYTAKNSQGTSENYVVTTTTVNYNTSFSQSGVTNASGSFTAIQSVALPDGTSYQFGYDSGTTAGHYGLLTSMTLPSGGTISYGYTNFTDAAATQNRWLNSRTSGGQWTYAPATASSGCQSGNGGCQKVTITKPSGDQTVYTFSLFGGGSWNTQTQYYTGGTTLLKTVATTFDFGHGSNVVRNQVVETMPIPGGANVNKQTQYFYDSSTTTANVNVLKEWNLYTTTPPASPDRETDTMYVTDSHYTGIYINNRPLTITVKNGAGTQVAQTTYSYDSTAIGTATSITHHDDTGYGTGMTYRGNPTVMSKWVSGSTSLSETKYYDMTGQLTELTDMNGNNTTYSYTDTFYTDSSNPSTDPSSYSWPYPTNAYLTQKALPVIGSETYGYYLNSGKKAKFQDQNSAITWTHYQDPLDRQTSVTNPPVNNGSSKGWSLTVYTSSTQHDTYIGINDTGISSGCSSCMHAMRTMDTMGRTTEQAMMSDPGGADKTDTSYDRRAERPRNPTRIGVHPRIMASIRLRMTAWTGFFRYRILMGMCGIHITAQLFQLREAIARNCVQAEPTEWDIPLCSVMRRGKSGKFGRTGINVSLKSMSRIQATTSRFQPATRTTL